jgi:hypothetical protein
MELLCWYKGDAFRLELSTKGGNLGARGTWTCVIDYGDGDAQWSCVGAVAGAPSRGMSTCTTLRRWPSAARSWITTGRESRNDEHGKGECDARVLCLD